MVDGSSTEVSLDIESNCTYTCLEPCSYIPMVYISFLSFLMTILPSTPIVVCAPPCENGACVANNTCSCAAGYEGALCNERSKPEHNNIIIHQQYMYNIIAVKNVFQDKGKPCQ